MTTATRTNRALYLPGRRLLTRQEFERIADSGAFNPEERLELIEGEILTKERPMKSPHATAISLAETALRRAFPEQMDELGEALFDMSAVNDVKIWMQSRLA